MARLFDMKVSEEIKTSMETGKFELYNCSVNKDQAVIATFKHLETGKYLRLKVAEAKLSMPTIDLLGAKLDSCEILEYQRTWSNKLWIASSFTMKTRSGLAKISGVEEFDLSEFKILKNAVPRQDKNDYHYNEVVGGYEVNLEEFAKSKFIMKYINKDGFDVEEVGLRSVDATLITSNDDFTGIFEIEPGSILLFDDGKDLGEEIARLQKVGEVVIESEGNKKVYNIKTIKKGGK